MLSEFLSLALAKQIYNRLNKGGMRGNNPKHEKEAVILVSCFLTTICARCILQLCHRSLGKS